MRNYIKVLTMAGFATCYSSALIGQSVDAQHPPYQLLAPQQKKVCDVLNLKMKEILGYAAADQKLTGLQKAQFEAINKPPDIQKYAKMFSDVMGDGTFTDWFGMFSAGVSQTGGVSLGFGFVCPADKDNAPNGYTLGAIIFGTVSDHRSFNPQMPGTDVVPLDAPIVKMLSSLPGNKSPARVSGRIFRVPGAPYTFVGYNDRQGLDINTWTSNISHFQPSQFSASFSNTKLLADTK